MSANNSACIQKIDKLIPRLRTILVVRQKVGINLLITHAIDDFFYQQKIEELSLLKEKLENGDRPTIVHVSDIVFTSAFEQWKRDARILNKFFVSKPGKA